MATFKTDIALDAEIQWQLDAFEFGKAEAAQFGAAEAQIGKPEQDIVLVDLGRKPGGRPNRIEEADDGRWIGLGHFIFVYIHPYMDGNGRMARFLMNVMMAAGGYDWTVIPVDRRRVYMEALEAASTRQDIDPFTEFLAAQIRNPVGKIGKVTKT